MRRQHLNHPKVTAAIMFLDVVGFSEFSDDQLRVYFGTYLPAIRQVIDGRFPPAAGAADLLEVNTWGDAVVLASSAAGTLAATALDIVDMFAAISRDVRAVFHAPVECRIALHVGQVRRAVDAVRGQKAVYGRQMSLTARMEPIALPGEIWTTGAFREHIQDLEPEETLGVEFESYGKQELAKGFGTRPVYVMRRRGIPHRPAAAIAKHGQLLPRNSSVSLLTRIVTDPNCDPIFRTAAGEMDLVLRWLTDLRRTTAIVPRFRELHIKHISAELAALLEARGGLRPGFWDRLQSNIHSLRSLLDDVRVDCQEWVGFPVFHGNLSGSHALIGRFESTDEGFLSHYTDLRYLDRTKDEATFVARLREFDSFLPGQHKDHA